VQIVQATTTSRGTSIEAVGLESLGASLETTTSMLSELALHQLSPGIVFFVFAWVSQGEWNSHTHKADIPQSSESHLEEIPRFSFCQREKIGFALLENASWDAMSLRSLTPLLYFVLIDNTGMIASSLCPKSRHLHSTVYRSIICDDDVFFPPDSAAA
jgi:hypothetical protein